ncbi:hypothetical protein OS493_039961 [Desmophyllum pertusum]|uniref:Uncharacterized protein n=1 Tax=Desmophyllum pertusum TaxID=174260 RepID=A0A9W9Y6N9_9CNID|nr:hypothetical protein OS493_039961 [Desmophyllum pertusum]
MSLYPLYRCSDLKITSLCYGFSNNFSRKFILRSPSIGSESAEIFVVCQIVFDDLKYAKHIMTTEDIKESFVKISKFLEKSDTKVKI